MTAVGSAIVVVKTVILVLGGWITVLAYRAYSRTNSNELLLLGVGFGIITFGVILGGVAHQILTVAIEVGVLLNSILVAIGFVVILGSLYTEEK
jgi:hypothetical protein